MFYNVENYFDAKVDTTSDYNEFTPDGERHWTYSKYLDKRNKIYKTITAIGGWEPPSIVAFAEIENSFVLEDLIENTPLSRQNYKVIHFESEDERCIDVGLIYLEDNFSPLHSEKIAIRFESNPGDKTRDILYVKGLLKTDTLHIFVNHWPSRYGGLLETKPLRFTAAQILKSAIDSVCLAVANPNIIVLGDFNDNPGDESIQYLLSGDKCEMKNLPLDHSNSDAKGTLKYQQDWDIFDQVIVSKSMTDAANELYVKDLNGNIFDAQFLLENDGKYLGMKPFRTFIGFRYNGGFSDHLPVFVDIYIRNNK